MQGEEQFQHIGEADNSIIEMQTYDFCMPGRTTADLFVTGVFPCATCVTTFDTAHPLDPAKGAIETPETPATQSSQLLSHNRTPWYEPALY
jgi:hypothetical protein